MFNSIAVTHLGFFQVFSSFFDCLIFNCRIFTGNVWCVLDVIAHFDCWICEHFCFNFSYVFTRNQRSKTSWNHGWYNAIECWNKKINLIQEKLENSVIHKRKVSNMQWIIIIFVGGFLIQFLISRDIFLHNFHII